MVKQMHSLAVQNASVQKHRQICINSNRAQSGKIKTLVESRNEITESRPRNVGRIISVEPSSVHPGTDQDARATQFLNNPRSRQGGETARLHGSQKILRVVRFQAIISLGNKSCSVQ